MWIASDRPKWKHDFPRCYFLGRFQKHDLYISEESSTLIARYGNEGSQYKSHSVRAGEPPHGELSEAMRRAEENRFFEHSFDIAVAVFRRDDGTLCCHAEFASGLDHEKYQRLGLKLITINEGDEKDERTSTAASP